MQEPHTGILGKEDIERLLSDKTHDPRIMIVAKISESYQQGHYNIDQLAVVEQILRTLVRDTEVTVRKALAQRLKDNSMIPRDIILSLSQDEHDEVCLPILAASPLLTDAELISLIRNTHHLPKQEAVASRNPLSKKVADALIDTKNPQVISRLTENLYADLQTEQYNRIVAGFAKEGVVMNAIAARPNLPVTVVEKIITLVSEKLADSLRHKYGLPTATTAMESEKTREVATLKLVDDESNRQEVEKLVEQLRQFGRLTPSIILTSLCRGNLYFFETSLAKLSNIPVKNAQMLIHDKGGMGFKALYKKAELPPKFFAACECLLEVVRDINTKAGRSTNKHYADDMAQNLIAKSAGKNIDNISYILALIRQVA